MIANPAMFPRMHATSTLTSGSRILAATRSGVQRHRRPYSIKSRDKLAMAVASAGRANRNDSSELVIGVWPTNSVLSPKPGSNQVPYDDGAAAAHRSKLHVQSLP